MGATLNLEYEQTPPIVQQTIQRTAVPVAGFHTPQEHNTNLVDWVGKIGAQITNTFLPIERGLCPK